MRRALYLKGKDKVKDELENVFKNSKMFDKRAFDN